MEEHEKGEVNKRDEEEKEMSIACAHLGLHYVC